jgi:hypothetical protein
MLQELILCKSSSPYKRKANLKAGGSFDLDSPINFAVMKRLKLKYGLWNYCKIKIREKSSSDATNKLMLHLQMVGKNLLDFPGIVSSNNYQRVVVFFDFGQKGTGATYYFDDIKQSN